MDRQIINFSANEQSLIKTGGTDHYAGNVVRYIEAHFDLGANWTGYDSVRAIWRNKRDATKVSTVLNSEGVCVVPYEVLTLRGDVCMNLVGSIVENDTLVDRLVTYPICALTVDVPAMVDGSDPASITPSEYEQFVASVANDANRAEAGAESAEASAQSASESAEQATLSAQASEASALRASGYASDAQASERNASEYAQNASESATSAENAKDDAETARDEILSMRAEATTLAEGSQATASYSDGVLTLGIPKGDTGAKGDKGDKGDTGATPNLSIGNVETLEPTESATATITGTAENPVLNLGLPQGRTGEVTYEDLESILPRDTATGNPITITDGQSVIPVKSLEVELEPIQDLHGYDKPWAGGAGKNILPITLSDGTVSGLNYTVLKDNGGNVLGIKLQGTPTTTVIELEVGSVTLTEGVGYKINGCSYPNSDLRLQLKKRGTSTSLVQVYNGRDAGYAPAETAEYFVTFVVILNGQAVDQTIYPMIRLSTNTDDTYVPYTNIAPISGWTDVDTYRTGKNIWGGTQLRDDILAKVPNAVADDTNKTIRYDASSVSGKNLFNKFKPNTQYTIILRGYNTNTSSQSENISIRYTDGTTQYTHGFVNGVSRTVTDASKSIEYIKGQWATSVTYLYYDECGVFEGVLTADQFEPYQGTTYTTDLGRTVYGGTLDVVSGELVVDRAMVDLGSLQNWRKSSQSGCFYVANVTPDYKKPMVKNPICSNYAFDGAVTSSSNYYGANGTFRYYAVTTSVATEFYFHDDRVQKASDIAEVIDGVQLVYELATPQTIQLTPQQVMLLTGDNNLWSDGEVELTYNADVQLWVLKQLGTSGTRTLSMTRTLAKSDDTDDTKTVQLAED